MQIFLTALDLWWKALNRSKCRGLFCFCFFFLLFFSSKRLTKHRACMRNTVSWFTWTKKQRRCPNTEERIQQKCVTLEDVWEWHVSLLLSWYTLCSQVAQHLAATYGGRAFEVAKIAQVTGKRWPIVGKRLVSEFPYIESEVHELKLWIIYTRVYVFIILSIAI